MITRNMTKAPAGIKDVKFMGPANDDNDKVRVKIVMPLSDDDLKTLPKEEREAIGSLIKMGLRRKGEDVEGANVHALKVQRDFGPCVFEFEGEVANVSAPCHYVLQPSVRVVDGEAQLAATVELEVHRDVAGSVALLAGREAFLTVKPVQADLFDVSKPSGSDSVIKDMEDAGVNVKKPSGGKRGRKLEAEAEADGNPEPSAAVA